MESFLDSYSSREEREQKCHPYQVLYHNFINKENSENLKMFLFLFLNCNS